MLKEYQKLRIPDESKQHEIVVEVNWDANDKKTNECKLLRMTFPNGDVALVKKEHLTAMLFAFGNEAEQRQLIPVITRRTRWYETVISVKAKKDIRKGENITFPLKLTLPTVEEEVFAEIKREKSLKDV